MANHYLLDLDDPTGRARVPVSAIIIPLVAAIFLSPGITDLFLARRVRKFWKGMPEYIHLKQ